MPGHPWRMATVSTQVRVFAVERVYGLDKTLPTGSSVGSIRGGYWEHFGEGCPLGNQQKLEEPCMVLSRGQP